MLLHVHQGDERRPGVSTEVIEALARVAEETRLVHRRRRDRRVPQRRGYRPGRRTGFDIPGSRRMELRSRS